MSTCIEDFQHKPKVCNDGAGGAIVAFYNDSGPRNIMAQRVDSNGTMLWGCAGLKINTTAPVSEMTGLFSDRQGGEYIVWTQNDYSTTPMPTFKTFVTRIAANGTPVWPTPAQVLNMQGNAYRGSAGTDTLGN